MSLQLMLPEPQARRLTAALKTQRYREIGGILMGEHVAPEQFRIFDLTIQIRGGTPVSFIRAVEWIILPLRRFFSRTRHNYTRFNYLGEWHSHPGLPLVSSVSDRETMWSIVNDPSVGVNFAVLLIVHLDPQEELAGHVEVFLPQHQIFQGELIKESS